MLNYQRVMFHGYIYCQSAVREFVCTRLAGYPAVCELRQATRGYGRLGDVLEGLKAGTAVAFFMGC